ncbi:hypothetical protein N7540_003670 [Penicillium herquei]|nr:hypothetical protein N7540_003670 [Penicillium herquei]
MAFHHDTAVNTMTRQHTTVNITSITTLMTQPSTSCLNFLGSPSTSNTTNPSLRRSLGLMEFKPRGHGGRPLHLHLPVIIRHPSPTRSLHFNLSTMQVLAHPALERRRDEPSVLIFCDRGGFRENLRTIGTES